MSQLHFTRGVMHLPSAPLRVRAASLLGALVVVATSALAGTSTAHNPSVVFTTPGTKTVTLKACNTTYWWLPPSCATKTLTVTVLDPTPSILDASVSPGELPIPQSFHLAATGTGRPPLSYSWRVLDASLVTVATLPGSTTDWSTASASAGAYSVVLDLTNGAGTTVSSLPMPIVVDADPRIFWSGFEDVPSPDPRQWDVMVSDLPPG